MTACGANLAPPHIQLTFAPTDAQFAAIFTALERETAPQTGPCHIQPLALLLRDSENQVAGGLWGRIVYSWLVIEMLVVPPNLRGAGAGKALIAQAEAAARSRGCIGMHLTRLDFQAPSFYEGLGFSTFGIQHDVPPGHCCHYLLKRLDQPPVPHRPDPRPRHDVPRRQ